MAREVANYINSGVDTKTETKTAPQEQESDSISCPATSTPNTTHVVSNDTCGDDFSVDSASEGRASPDSGSSEPASPRPTYSNVVTPNVSPSGSEHDGTECGDTRVNGSTESSDDAGRGSYETADADTGEVSASPTSPSSPNASPSSECHVDAAADPNDESVSEAAEAAAAPPASIVEADGEANQAVSETGEESPIGQSPVEETSSTDASPVRVSPDEASSEEVSHENTSSVSSPSASEALDVTPVSVDITDTRVVPETMAEPAQDPPSAKTEGPKTPSDPESPVEEEGLQEKLQEIRRAMIGKQNQCTEVQLDHFLNAVSEIEHPEPQQFELQESEEEDEPQPLPSPLQSPNKRPREDRISVHDFWMAVGDRLPAQKLIMTRHPLLRARLRRKQRKRFLRINSLAGYI